MFQDTFYSRLYCLIGELLRTPVSNLLPCSVSQTVLYPAPDRSWMDVMCARLDQGQARSLVAYCRKGQKSWRS